MAGGKPTEKVMTGSEIRSAFLKYFEEKGHTVVGSSSLVPHDDPTLLFANAGMNQFKDVFLGKVTRPYVRATTCQKVVRAGGKHNDLENVGRTSRHHTFFEMLGNFSFGDYFKKEAIAYAWDFLTNVVSLPADKLYVSVFEDDDEAFNIWRDMVGLPEHKIIRMGEKDNFWQMGDTGPCGPCSEIHIDQGVGTGCGEPDCSPFCSCDRHLELWNLVFMQYNRDEKGVLHPLPKPSIDTGMGLERVTSVVQKKSSNYNTDLIMPIIDFTAKLANVIYGADQKNDVSLRVMADHARSTTFLISDGVMPSNEGRGYVLRRIMRRAMRHAKQLGLNEPSFYKVCSFVIEHMKAHYIELADKKSFVEKIVLAEEEAFSRTLNNGLRIINEEIIDKLPKGQKISGEMIFKLYDTHGFPIDLLQDVVEDEGFSLDIEGFDKFMALQQERAKKAGLSTSAKTLSDAAKSLGVKFNTVFTGYYEAVSKSPVVAIIENGKESKNISSGDNAEIILSETPFYPEGGGQVADSGSITFDKGIFEVSTVYKAGTAIIHKGRLLSGKIAVGDIGTAAINKDKRRSTERNHTATHLLHKALQQVLGDHVRQAGSFVNDEYLRFDFTHFGQITTEEKEQIADIVNNAIMDELVVTKTVKPHAEAIKSGAMALFGEKYDDTVRVVEIDSFSKELCGGCHVDTSSDIGLFIITSEGSVAAGVRRIEGLTGRAAIKFIQNREKNIDNLAKILKSNPADITSKVIDIQNSADNMEKLLKQARHDLSMINVVESIKTVRTVNDIQVLTIKYDVQDMEELRAFVDMVADRLKTKSIILVASVIDGKASYICRVTSDITSKYKAGALIKEIAKIAGGSGGGKDEMAQAGAKDISKINDALNRIYELV